MKQIGYITNDTSVVSSVFTRKSSRVEPSVVEGASDETLGNIIRSSDKVEVLNNSKTENKAANNADNTLIHLSSEDTVSENQSYIEESKKDNVEKENEK